MIEFRIDAVQVQVAIGKWRGAKKLGEYAPPQPLRLFAKDDEAALPFGRALEDLLAQLITQLESEEGSQ